MPVVPRKVVFSVPRRVSPGKCYHLYNGLRASLLDAYQLPEIQRTPLEELCLQIKVGVGSPHAYACHIKAFRRSAGDLL